MYMFFMESNTLFYNAERKADTEREAQSIIDWCSGGNLEQKLQRINNILKKTERAVCDFDKQTDYTAYGALRSAP